MKRDDSGINGLAAGLLVFGIILIIGMIGDATGSSTNKCINSGCDNERAPGSIYCYLHKPYMVGSTTTKKSTGASSSSSYNSGSSNMTNSSGTGNSTKATSNYSKGTSSGSRTYKTLNNDPED